MKLFKVIGNRIGLTGRRFIRTSLLISTLWGASAPPFGCTSPQGPQQLDAGIPQSTAAAAPITPPELPQPLRDPKIAEMLLQSLRHYRAIHIDTDGRPLAAQPTTDLTSQGIKGNQYITFSESIAYSIKIAALQGDLDTVDKVLDWFTANMQRSSLKYTWARKRGKWVTQPVREEFINDLPFWRFVPEMGIGPDGKLAGGVIDDHKKRGKKTVDIITASDDIEIVSGLVMASFLAEGERKEKYLEEAGKIARAAWDKYIKKVGDKYYFAAGDTTYRFGELLMNLSYFRPYEFRYLIPVADPDPDHPWHLVADNFYDIWERSGQLTIGEGKDKREGKNLAPTWLAVNFEENLLEGYDKMGIVAEMSGWDGCRNFYGPAQDMAWSANPLAQRYMTDCSVGPRCAVRDLLNPEQSAATAWHHDLKPIVYTQNVPETFGLDKEQLAMYGPYYAFFYYAGDKTLAERILKKIKDSFCTYEVDGEIRGYWPKRKDPRTNKCYKQTNEGFLRSNSDYYAQSLLYFGLSTVNGLPPELETGFKELLIKKLAAERKAEAEAAAVQNPGTRAILDREWALETLTSEDMEEALNAIASSPGIPLRYDRSQVTGSYPQLAILNKLGLRIYFTNFSEYWNNAITLLSAFSEKIVKERKTDKFEVAVRLSRQFRTSITTENAGFVPNDYVQILLNLTEAKLISQTTKQSPAFYEEGIRKAVAAIKGNRDLDHSKAHPNHYLFAEALSVIAESHLQIYRALRLEERFEKDEQRKQELRKKIAYHFKRAAKFFDHVRKIPNGLKIDKEDKEDYVDSKGNKAFFTLKFTKQHIDEAIKFNFSQGYLPETDPAKAAEKAKNALASFSALAKAKIASRYIEKEGAKSIAELDVEIKRSDQAVTKLIALAKGKETYALAFARRVAADLRLFLVYRTVFEEWPENGGTDADVKRIQGIIEKHMGEARALYKKIPAKYAYLFGAGQVKILEIAVSLAEFMDLEFDWLVPFFTHPALKDDGIADDEFLGITKNQLIALLLVSTKNPRYMTMALGYLEKVLKYSKDLEYPYDQYFKIHATLKKGEILARLKKKTEARKLFEQVEKEFQILTPKDLKKLAWNPSSFLAELYHEWAAATGNKAMASKAMDHCKKSPSKYDRTKRHDLLEAFIID